jgi:hypothetical protein
MKHRFFSRPISGSHRGRASKSICTATNAGPSPAQKFQALFPSFASVPPNGVPPVFWTEGNDANEEISPDAVGLCRVRGVAEAVKRLFSAQVVDI